MDEFCAGCVVMAIRGTRETRVAFVEWSVGGEIADRYVLSVVCVVGVG